MHNSEHLASFVHELRYADLPEEVVAKAEEIVQHTWGVQLAASSLPWSRQVAAYVRDQGAKAESTVAHYGIRTTAALAAFANGVFAHGFELDDNHATTAAKLGCIAVPVSLAMGEVRHASGRDVITGIVAAYEVATRVGLAIWPGMWAQMASPTGVVGPFAAAVASARLLSADTNTLADALCAAASHRIGLIEMEPGRGNLKRLYAGMAAAAGVEATQLALMGLRGSRSTLDLGTGFMRTFGVGESAIDSLTAGLGEDWEILKVHYKLYAQDGYIQPMTEALRLLRERHRFDVEDVASVTLGTNRLAHDRIIGPIREPRSLTDAHFSATFSAALFLLTGGAGMAQYTDESLHDPRVRDLAKRVSVVVDPVIDAEHESTRGRGASVAVRLTSGLELRQTVTDLRLLSTTELDDKFRDLSSMVLSRSQSDQLLEVAKSFREVRDVAEIVPLLNVTSRRHDLGDDEMAE